MAFSDKANAESRRDYVFMHAGDKMTATVLNQLFKLALPGKHFAFKIIAAVVMCLRRFLLCRACNAISTAILS